MGNIRGLYAHRTRPIAGKMLRNDFTELGKEKLQTARNRAVADESNDPALGGEPLKKPWRGWLHYFRWHRHFKVRYAATHSRSSDSMLWCGAVGVSAVSADATVLRHYSGGTFYGIQARQFTCCGPPSYRGRALRHARGVRGRSCKPTDLKGKREQTKKEAG